MNCYICESQNVEIAAKGMCFECNQFVCGRPPKRRDRQFHADQCICGCRKLICEIDFEAHAAAHHGSVPLQCFPKRSLSNAAIALHSSLEAGILGESVYLPDAFYEHTAHINHFLSAIAIGSQTLGLWQASYGYGMAKKIEIGARHEVWLVPTLFRGETSARIAAFAARIMATIGLKYDLRWMRVALNREAYRSFGAILSAHAPALPRTLPRRPLFDFRAISLLNEKLPAARTIESLPRLPPQIIGGMEALEWVMEAGATPVRA